jgi:hypothetical protein
MPTSSSTSEKPRLIAPSSPTPTERNAAALDPPIIHRDVEAFQSRRLRRRLRMPAAREFTQRFLVRAAVAGP